MTIYDSEMIVPDGWGFVRSMDRREFLQLTGTGLLVIVALPIGVAAQEPARAASGRGSYPTDLNAYLHIGADGRVTTFVGKVELGQGAMTSLPQLVAEELDLPLSMIDIVMGDTDVCPWDSGTFGSQSIRQFGPVLRAAAAEARAVLLQLAAERLAAPVSDLNVDNGVIVHAADPSKKLTYGALTGGRRIERRVEMKPALEAPATFTIVGRTASRRDAIDKVTGRAKYAGDIVPDGALHARVLHPPTHGAKLVSVDTSAAEKQPGVIVARESDLVAVLHAHRDEADAALDLVRAQWTPSPNTLDHTSIHAHLEQHAPSPQTAASGGAIADGEKLAVQVVEDTYRDGYVAHAPMETHSAVAAFADGTMTVWAGTQTPFPVKSQVARLLNLPPEKVRVVTPYVGGGFGGKSAALQAHEAARLAMIVRKPVRVVWSRDEEFFFDTFRPASVITVRAGLDASKKIVFWDYHVVAAGERGAAHFYDIPHHRTVVQGGWNATAGFHPFAVGPWRAPGCNSNTFARESHIDQLAAAAGADPVEFRLAHASDERIQRVLRAAATQFGWTTNAGPDGHGRGVAVGRDVGTFVATMADVRVDKRTGQVDVLRVVCAQDMGLVVNPEGAVQQMEGCIAQGLGYALTEEVRFRNGEVLDRNFDTYELPRFSWMPKVETIIVDSPGLAAQGGGEPAIIVMGAVIANAIFDATGARLRQMPFTRDRVKAALAVS
jgi:CO/xanthine dehydrogenase Mo-binding subunit